MSYFLFHFISFYLPANIQWYFSKRKRHNNIRHNITSKTVWTAWLYGPEWTHPHTSAQKHERTRENDEPWQGVPNNDSKVTFKVANQHGSEQNKMMDKGRNRGWKACTHNLPAMEFSKIRINLSCQDMTGQVGGFCRLCSLLTPITWPYNLTPSSQNDDIYPIYLVMS